MVLSTEIARNGDIKIKIVDIERLTIQVRLILSSVDTAREMGLDWWTTNPDFRSKAPPRRPLGGATPHPKE